MDVNHCWDPFSQHTPRFLEEKFSNNYCNIRSYIMHSGWTFQWLHDVSSVRCVLAVGRSPGVTKRFDPRAEFETAWPPEDRIYRDLRDRQQPMLLHCCPQSETWCLKVHARYYPCLSLYLLTFIDYLRFKILYEFKHVLYASGD